MGAPVAPSMRRLARDTLGFDRLRAGQEDAVRSLVTGRDTLVVMPTGGGKSAIFQLAGAAMPGPTVVVSPLLSLQYDQVTSLREARAGEAAALNSAVPEREREEILGQANDG